ncbi:MAG: triose-phosphate isomerase [Bacilli bacterium]|nr:triose-phosphate isomerase [Bacilli bacterium]MDD4282575.1 triose-phosphate isomerase [Bacilli bacterium]MDD4718796.1 triose-phosphate isomerase [Bacilli bacterium]
MENEKIVVGNLKTKMNIEEISQYLKVINKEVISEQVIICPTSIYIPYFLKQRYKVGLQNTFINEDGPYTGEITPNQATSMGIHYTIIGHSERRINLNEDDELINKKMISAVKSNMNIILCIGETIEEKQMLKTDMVLRRQLVNALNGLSIDMLHNVIIAYEPVWAIGTNNVASIKEIERTANYIKMIVHQNRGYKNMRVIYGGSVNEQNIKELNQIKNISGFLVGGASTDTDKFLSIINEVVVNQ